MHDIDSTANEIIDQLTNEYSPVGYEGESEALGTDNEVDLAMELLGASSDSELDQFFGNILKKAVRAGSTFMRGPGGQMLKGALRGLAKKYLPVAGAALGNYFVPGVGGAMGSKLAGMLGSAVGLEGEMSDSEVEEEVAKRLLRVANQAAVQVARDVQAGAEPKTAVGNALQNALQRHLPGLGGNRLVQCGGGRSGRWVRRGQRIVLFGV